MAPAGPAAGTVATVIRIDFGALRVRDEAGRHFDASARGRLMGARKALGNVVVVGDRVVLAPDGGRVMVVEVEPRRNAFRRRASGERREEQVVAANLDQVVVVASVRRPEFRHGFVDRVLTQAASAAIPARIALNKTDLAEGAEIADLVEEYARADVPVHPVCGISGEGIEALLGTCWGRRSLFVGHSGVGKSTLLARLAPGATLLAGDVNERTGKGRHTTTAAVLIEPRPGLELIDTPGVRTLGLWGVSSESLASLWPELRPHVGGCRFANCRHGSEPGCALRAARDAGTIGERRWASFLKLRDELTA